MGCRYIFNGKEYPGAAEFRDAALADPSMVAEHVGAKSVPSAPFVTSTEGWTNLAFKRMLRYAAENGFDRVAWTKGEQQAARYDLSKHLDSVEHRLSSWNSGGKTWAITAKDKFGKVVFDEGSANAERIEAVLGKEMAAKISATTEPGKLTGLDLKVGGEGMKGFYDQILPAVAGKLGKKWGAKVGETEIGAGGYRVVEIGPNGFQIVGPTGEPLRDSTGGTATYRSRTAADAAASVNAARSERVHSMDITPEMRRSVMEEGQPQFALKGKGEADSSALKARIAEVFPTLKAKQVAGGFIVPTPSGRRILIKPEGGIAFNQGAVERGHGSKAAERVVAGEMRIAGSTQDIGKDSLIRIVDEGVLPHEVAHVVRDHFANARENKMIDRRFGPEAERQGRKVDEVWADWHNEWFDGGGPRRPAKGLLERVSHRIHDFFEKLAYTVRPTAEGLSRRIASGEVFERPEAPTPKADATAYAVKAKPIPPKNPAVEEHRKLYERVSKEIKAPSEGFKERFFQTDPHDTRAIADLLKAERHPTLKDYAYEAWINGLLSAPPPHFANIIGNAMTQALRVPEKAIAGAIDAARSAITGKARERYVGEAYADLMGIRQGLVKAASVLKRGVLEESPHVDGKVEYQPSIPGKTGEVIRLPTRMLSAMDNAFKAVAETRESHSQAYRKAKSEGLSGSALQSRISSILGNLTEHPEILEAMKSEASYQTFTKEQGAFGKKFIELRNAEPTGLAKVVVPFFNTPLNIAKYTLERTPLNFLRLAKMWHEGRLSGGELSSELAKPLMGTLIGLGFAAAASEGFLTGAGPSDPRKRQLLKDTGWQPYSLKVGKQYISIQRFEPLSSIAGFAADMVEAKDEEKADLVNKIVGSVAENLTNKTFLQGVENIALAYSDPQRFASTWAKQMEGSVVPAILGRAAQAVDKNVRETNAVDGSAILARIPFASLMLQEKRSGKGEPIVRQGTAFERFASPAARTTEKGSEADLERAMVESDYVPSGPPKSLSIQGRKVELSDREYRFLQKQDEKATAYLRRVVTSPRFRSMDADYQKRYIRSIYEKYGKQAAEEIKRTGDFRKRFKASAHGA